ncbi:hypothetical protein L3X38_019982 [Prunus dulcis]|uniref:Uncharacterized protein n=1 Tax=Prunus dulcis TaxID=3755 RepID=A0AAD4WCX3_PRUDU|nr:hypothetical protein L3X38_019982 [Prunus dulcis]
MVVVVRLGSAGGLTGSTGSTAGAPNQQLLPTVRRGQPCFTTGTCGTLALLSSQTLGSSSSKVQGMVEMALQLVALAEPELKKSKS